MQTKLRAKQDPNAFKPYDFVVSKERTKVSITSKPIPWAELTEDQKMRQWGHCANALWHAEKEEILKRKDMEKYLYPFMAKLGYTDRVQKMMQTLKEHELPTYVLSATFLLANGADYKEAYTRTVGYIEDIVDRMNQARDEAKKKTVVKVEAKPERDLKWELNQVMAQMDEIEDDVGLSIHGNKSSSKLVDLKVDPLKWLAAMKVDKAFVPTLLDYQRKKLDELKIAVDGTDEDVKFSYSKYRKPQLRAMLSWFEMMVHALQTYGATKQVERKARVRKPVPPEKLVKRLKFLPKHEELGLESVAPTKIVGAKEVWIYNVKYKKLGVYVASELEQQLTVKGSGLIGYDPNLSVSKTLRKPEETLASILKTTKAGLRKAFKDIKTKESPLNGRFNGDTIILKVF